MIYGADVAKRQDIFESLLKGEAFIERLPDSQKKIFENLVKGEIFTDRRLVTEEDIIRMEQEQFGQQGGFGLEEEEGYE